MNEDFWKQAWQEGRTAFHEGKPNELLAAQVHKLGKPKRVLMPLAGKTEDLRFLAAKGHDVVGVEVVRQAIDEFFAESGWQATAHKLGAHDAFYANGVTLVQANMFDVKPETIGRFGAIYDRAALVAMNPSDQPRYVQTCRALLEPGGGTLLVAYSYSLGTMEGPPFSTDRATLDSLYAGCSVEELGARDVERVDRKLHETIYWIV